MRGLPNKNYAVENFSFVLKDAYKNNYYIFKKHYVLILRTLTRILDYTKIAKDRM